MAELRDILPAVRDQGVRGTCLAIAVTDGHHASRREGPSLSVDYLHFQAVQRDKGGLNEGVSLYAIREALAEDVQPGERDCPYSPDARDGSWSPDPVSVVWKRHSAAPSPTWDTIYSVLVKGEPAVLVLGLTDEFWEQSETLIDGSEGAARGRHAVLALAVHETESRVLIRNSWGDEWGQGGYGWVSARYLQARCVAVLTFGEGVQ